MLLLLLLLLLKVVVVVVVVVMMVTTMTMTTHGVTKSPVPSKRRLHWQSIGIRLLRQHLHPRSRDHRARRASCCTWP